MPVRELLLSQMFVQMADTLTEDFDLIDLLTVLSEGCVDLFEAAESGVVLADHEGALHLMVASSERVRMLELSALQHHEGPGLECFQHGRAVVTPDLEARQEGGRFAREAIRVGIGSVDALPMRRRATTIGSLDIFRSSAATLVDTDVAIAQALADVATIAILLDHATRESQGLVEQLQTALNSRVAIEQAKGILAERADVDVKEAFSRLRRYARDHNRRLTVVAKELVDGTLPAEAMAGLVRAPRSIRH